MLPPSNANRAFAMLRMASPMLPIGGFSYSQGQEQAIELGWVADEASAARWMISVLECSFRKFEAPLVWRICETPGEAPRLNTLYLATRETAELRAETLQMGFSLAQLLEKLDKLPAWASQARDQERLSLPGAWSVAAQVMKLGADEALYAYLFAWLENQVMAALKAVPLGQQAGQRILSEVLPVMSRIAEQAPGIVEDDWSNFACGLAIASTWHETQYSRMFRS